MKNNNDALNIWMSLTNSFTSIHDRLENALEEQYDLSLKEFYVLYFISNSEDKELRLQQVQELIGLSQSATSRLVVRMEAKNCGALERHVCEDDKRGIYTRITELGENKFHRALVTVNEILQKELQQGELTKVQSLFDKK
ncbi:MULTISPECIES: MarR family winged helix-turn-helix transcriptional regulator [Paenibacillus]|uniref:DNA-binding MarR family transcriptional regulator n=1 Tax=Paenibacillus amylolyticus TaxID=1451 RepID=A0AAP5H5P0_PAEAM|nr:MULTISPECIES: MarR family transcriptional regulator [Paenibacillus]MCM3171992.1 MarR family transcriptional regulator [Paenibacillus sp. MER 99-2]MDR6724514.1 DNA-binding MarR family transcriptional regulator [Paenibacillus amylolyticus]